MASLKWWQKANFYQIYPRSFADGNGDGIGDLHGMIEKLDYLQDLGIDAVWLSPHYPSPLWDCGYDVSDYTGVAPEYGTLDDIRRFLDEAHRRNIRVILDLVLNHTSDQHPWFIESRSSRDNPRRDWYLWADPKPDGSPPNNWYSTFGGPAWEYDAATDSYYYHFFFKQQPDLNWRNPAVKQAMFDAARFWLEMGVDGFRLDAIGTIYEEPDLRDQQAGVTQEELYKMASQAQTPEEWEKLSPLWEEMFRYQHDLPGIHDLMKELRQVVDAYPDRVLVGETDEISFYGNGEDELHMVFNFTLMRTEKLTPAWVRENQKTRLAQLPPLAWPCNTLGNHDSPRVYNRWGDGEHNDALARLNLVLLLGLKGTPFLYNGEEVGMSDYLITDPEKMRDQTALFFYGMAKTLGNMPEEEARKLAAAQSRDKNRTPNQWSNSPNAGFSPAGVETWLPVNPNYAEGFNVADQQNDPASLLNFYRAMLRLRQHSPALLAGEYLPLPEESQQCLVFERRSPQQRCLLALNMTDHPQVVSLSGEETAKSCRLLLSTHTHSSAVLDWPGLKLAPFEACVIELAA